MNDFKREAIESICSVVISPDKMTASLQFSKVGQGFGCSAADLMEFLKMHQVTYGIKYDVLHEISQDPSKFGMHTVVVAAGDPPVDGVDGQILFHTEMNASAAKPREQEDGSVDFKEVRTLSNVRKGQLIAEKVAPKPGIPGKTVTGELVPPRNGKPAHFKMGKNVVVDEQQQKMYAAIDGLVTRTEQDKINVFPVYEVNGDVDYRTGNIQFVGTVIVRGNVLSGFRIQADGDIRVYGGVEGAELEAGGSVMVTAGIVAHNKGWIKAGKDVKSSFIQDANVVSGENVIVSQSIMHSQIRAGKTVECLGVKGLIVGGVIQAGESVIARTIGNSMSTATVIEVGVLPEVRIELVQLREKLKQHAENLKKTDQALQLLNQLAAQGRLTEDKNAMRMKLTLTKNHTEAEQSEIKERILELEKLLENAENGRIDVHSVIYGGTKIVIGRNVRFIKEPYKRVSFRISEGEIAITALY